MTIYFHVEMRRGSQSIQHGTEGPSVWGMPRKVALLVYEISYTATQDLTALTVTTYSATNCPNVLTLNSPSIGSNPREYKRYFYNAVTKPFTTLGGPQALCTREHDSAILLTMVVWNPQETTVFQMRNITMAKPLRPHSLDSHKK